MELTKKEFERLYKLQRLEDNLSSDIKIDCFIKEFKIGKDFYFKIYRTKNFKEDKEVSKIMITPISESESITNMEKRIRKYFKIKYWENTNITEELKGFK